MVPTSGITVYDSDAAEVNVKIPAPAISIHKSLDSQPVTKGDIVTFTITVTNTGDEPLTNVIITDTITPDCEKTIIGTFAPTSVITSYTCSTVAGVDGDFTNVALVSGQGVTTTAVVYDSDAAEVNVKIPAPSISIQKSPDSQTVTKGDIVTFTITVTNTGDEPLTNVIITDTVTPSCEKQHRIGTFAPTAVITSYTCSTVSGVNGDFTNVALVSGQGVTTTAVVYDSDAADVNVKIPAPSISIQKSPDSQTVTKGDIVTFTITVTNTGDEPLTNVIITDTITPACEKTIIGTFAPTAVITSYTCSTVSGVNGDFTNVALVSGQGVTTTAVVYDSDAADVDVIIPAPSISIDKTPDNQPVTLHDSATFTITVTNNGTEPLENVEVSDPLAPNCDRTLTGIYPTGVITTYSCTVDNVTQGFTNVALVSGQGITTSDIVEDSDLATVVVDVPEPGIIITKTADQTVTLGGIATFDITVTNIGNEDLINVAVTDPFAADCDRNIGSLPLSAPTVAYTCTVTNVRTSFTNVAIVNGEGTITGDPVDDTDSADVTLDVPGPAIVITKTPDIQIVPLDSNAVFTISVTNVGNEALENVTITDPLTSGCNKVVGNLAINATSTYTCTYTNVQNDFTNVAIVTGEGVITGDTVKDADDADVMVDIPAPAIIITKTTSTPMVLLGSDATFTIEVTNIGDEDLTAVTVSDPLTADCNNPIGDLAIGATKTYTCTYSSVQNDFTNVAIVTGDGVVTGGSVSDSDNADVMVDIPAPAILITKTTSTPMVLLGSDATFAIEVTNIGDEDLSNVMVTDPLTPNCDNTIGNLAMGDTITYTCIYTDVQNDFTNVAIVTGDGVVTGGSVSDSDNADVMVDIPAPAIIITKTTSTPMVLLGSDATFAIEVTNIGDEDLSNVMVTDPLTPNCDNTIGNLAMGDTITYTCIYTDVQNDFTNVAIVTGDGVVTAGSVSDSDNADVMVDIPAPAIIITKTTSTPMVLLGSDATFTIEVTNIGDEDLSNVMVTDPLTPNCDNTIGNLAMGDTTTYNCTYTNVQNDFTNVAIVTGDGVVTGNAVQDADNADVMVIIPGPAIEIAKTPDTQNVVLGSAVTFTIVVTNNGTEALINVNVIDPLTPDCDSTIGNLAIGATITYSCTYTNVQSNFTNVALANGTGTLTGNEVNDADSAEVYVRELGSIGNALWHDTNSNGVQDSGEPPLVGVTVILTMPNGTTQQAVTDANGQYLFTGLEVGTYTITVDSSTLPADKLLAPSHDPDGGADSTSTVNLTTGNLNNLSQDFGYEPMLGSIGDTIWHDTNGNGIMDAGELPLAGVSVYLTDENGDPLAFTTTNAGGQYLFSNLPLGTYNVTVDTSTLPSDKQIIPSADPDGGDDSTSTTELTVNAPNDLNQDFAYQPLPPGGVIGDLLWHDTNGNGVKDPGEMPLEGVTVILTLPDGSTQSTMTDASGQYLFTGLEFGDYVVTVDTTTLPAGKVLTPSYDPDGNADSTSAVTLTSADSDNRDQDFGYEPMVGSIGDTIWHDTNGNGIMDAGELPLAGVSVYLTDENGDPLAFTTTNAGGQYLFSNLPLGTYNVTVDTSTLPSDKQITPSADPDGGDDSTSMTTLTVTAPDDLNQDFAYQPLPPGGVIGDVLWHDVNGNGVKDPGELPLVDVTVILTLPDGSTQSTLTDASGQYLFTGLELGDYTVTVDTSTLPAGKVLTPSYDPDGNADNTSAVTLSVADSDNRDQDFGYEPMVGSIGDTIWHDTNGNGVMDAGELPLAGVVVRLTDENGLLVGIDTTDANGNYLFSNVPLGTYHVTVDTSTLPSDKQITPIGRS
jgi:uncharacterized repeat protein (TIGR01451 family)